MNKALCLLALPALLSITALATPLKVASLHPLLGDIIKQIGKDKIKVTNICKPGMDTHKFQPSTADIRAMAQCPLIFASGKGLEPYLFDLLDSLNEEQIIIFVGETIPSQVISLEKDQSIYGCCPTHTKGSVDPHWWHNVEHMERAVRIIAKELSVADPENKTFYEKQSKALAEKMRELHRWVKAQVAQIPPNQRHLVTAHAAFGYFCKAYGFRASFVEGLNRESEISTKKLAETIRTLKKEQIKAIFPEKLANPKTLKQIALESGANIGNPLIADGSVESYEDMIRQNVTHIVSALTE